MGIMDRLGFCGDGELVFRLPMCGDEDTWAMPMIKVGEIIADLRSLPVAKLKCGDAGAFRNDAQTRFQAAYWAVD